MSLCKRSENKVFVVDNMHGIVEISPQKGQFKIKISTGL